MSFLFIILAATFTPITISFFYFRKQKAICHKYPFYALRDKVVWEIIRAGSNPEIETSYKKVNYVAQKLKEFNFGFMFFMETMTDLLGDVIEKKYREALEEPSLEKCSLEINPLDKELAILVIDAAKKNSILLRSAMTKAGFRILFWPLLVRAIYKVIKKHPTLLQNRRSQFKTIQKYSVLAHCV